MWKDSEESEEEEEEVLGLFFQKHYSKLLEYLDEEDVVTMSILNKKWNERIDSHKIWVALMGAIQGKKPKNKEAKPKDKVKEEMKTTSGIIRPFSAKPKVIKNRMESINQTVISKSPFNSVSSHI